MQENLPLVKNWKEASELGYYTKSRLKAVGVWSDSLRPVAQINYFKAGRFAGPVKLYRSPSGSLDQAGEDH